MRNWMKNAGHVALVGAGFFAIGSGIASADVSDNHDSLLSGNQVEAPVSAPINLTGNALSALGGSASAKGPSQNQSDLTRSAEPTGLMSSNRRSILSGNQIKAPISVPINVCGNAVALRSFSRASCGDSSTAAPAAAPEAAPAAAPVAAPAAAEVPATACERVAVTPTAPKPACATAPTTTTVPAQSCQPPETSSTSKPETSSTSKAPCESDAARTLPATNPFAVTSMAPTRKQHAATQEVMTYEKLTKVRQAAGSVVEAPETYVTTPNGAVHD